MEENIKYNDFFNKLGKETRAYFKESGFIPQNLDQADEFVKKDFNYDSNEPIYVEYIDSVSNTKKNIDITKSNFYDAFYFDVFNSLSVEDTIRALKWAFEHCNKKYGTNLSKLMLFTDDARNSIGSSSKSRDDIFLNFNYILNFEIASYDFLNTIVHELTHKKQEKISNQLMKSVKTNLTDYERSYLADHTDTMARIFENIEEMKKFSVNNEFIAKYRNIKDKKKFNKFLFDTYLKNYSEIKACEAGAAYAENVYAYHNYKFGQSKELDKYFNTYIKMNEYDKNLYKIDKKNNPNYVKNINNFSDELNNLYQYFSLNEKMCENNMKMLSDNEYYEFKAKYNVPYVWKSKEQVNSAKYTNRSFVADKKIRNMLIEIIDFYEKNTVPKNFDKRVDTGYKDLIKTIKEVDKHNKEVDEYNK